MNEIKNLIIAATIAFFVGIAAAGGVAELEMIIIGGQRVET